MNLEPLYLTRGVIEMDENTNTTQNTTGSKTMPIVIGVIALLLIAGGAYLFMSNKNSTVPTGLDANTTGENNSSNATTEPTGESTTDGSENENDVAAVKTFEISGSNFKFDPTEITVKKGDTVRIVFTNSGGMHDWVIDEFDARTKVLKDSESETIEFVADEIGTFEYYCSVGSHRQMGMVGDLIVEE